ncbi:hypothetical protein [Cyclobacterium plantarum]|uniref:hypothetical protein n=1 Tax=Cyclobacterium plantarum TaxID=2716263 RepID=UPI003F6E54BB
MKKIRVPAFPFPITSKPTRSGHSGEWNQKSGGPERSVMKLFAPVNHFITNRDAGKLQPVPILRVDP